MNFAAFDMALFGRMFLYSVVASLVLTAVGAPCIAAVCERLAVARKRSFYDKLGLQLATLGLVCGLGTLPFPLVMWVGDWAGNWFYLYVKHPDLPLPSFSLLLAGGASLLVAGCYAAALVVLIVYRATWTSMKKSKGLHSSLGLAAAALGLLTIVLALLYKRMALHDPALASSSFGFDALLSAALGTPAVSLLWPAVLLAAMTSLSAAGGFGLAYLLLRRNTEDFGRDYYVFGLKQCASWAFTPTFASVGAVSWLVVVQLDRIGVLALHNPKLYYLAAGLLLGLVASVAWSHVARSETPLRRKPSVVLGCLCLPLSFTAFFAFLRLLLQS